MTQQGDRLGKYRLDNKIQAFKPSQFNVMLLTQDGEFVKANFGSSFMQSLLNDEFTLAPGNYVAMVDPIWDSSANNDPF